ncbi:MAG: RagB/SusD family nutrient uptake outer membrane protein [Bacteroidetes bacterium]|nr:MAG: RagB/SusD family nutrient uptake outer membrane protein [Bacteroidota bacterium]
MKKIFHLYAIAALLMGLLCFTSCEIEEVVDPNNPSLGSVTNDASKAELQTLVTGLEARHRNYFGSATQMFGSFGREVWAYFGSDPRFLSHWLGIGVSQTYPDFFASAGTYTTPYLAVKQANVLISAAQASSSLNPREIAAYTGFAKTVKGHQLIYPLMQQNENGIRIDVEDPLKPGPIVDYNTAIKSIQAILDEGYQDLQNAGNSLPFTLTSGYAGFDDPASLAQVNRAIAARAALYANDYAGALSALNESFMDLNGDLMRGPAHVYGEAPDVNNPLFYPLDKPTNTILIVHPAMIEDAIPGDGRLSKFAKRVNNPASNPGLTDANGQQIPGEYQDARWASNTAPIPYIRNEELILIYAEAKLMTGDPNEAIRAINIIRNAWGIGDYTGGNSQDEILEEILFQRRYSLWAEGGHRWIDLRRTGKLDANHVDLRDGGVLFTQVARRTSESN